MTIASTRAQAVAEILWELKRADKLATLSAVADRAGFPPGPLWPQSHYFSDLFRIYQELPAFALVLMSFMISWLHHYKQRMCS